MQTGHKRAEKAPTQRRMWTEIWRRRELYLIVLPGVVYFIVIKYFPLYFIQVAFRNYQIGRSVWDSTWAGLTYFSQLFNAPDFWLAVKNTVIINSYKLIFGFPAPIILALVLNEVRSFGFKRTTQTIVYLPHFVSWVVVAGIMYNFLSIQGGLINVILGLFHVKPVGFLIHAKYFRGILVISSIWKEMGWGTILYLAAMSGINPELYESATIDGATHPQQVWHITLPGIMYVIVILLIIQVGDILSEGYDQIFVLYNTQMRTTGLVLQYYVYATGLQQLRFSYAAAAGLFNTVIAFVMVFAADRAAKSAGQRGIF